MTNAYIVGNIIEKKNKLKRDYNFKILLVEDSPIVAMATSRMLAAYGYEIDIAETGELGIEKFQTNVYDVILMDIDLPGIDGITATHKIRELEHTNKKTKTPVMSFSANTDKSAEDMKVFDHIFIKPLLANMADIIYEKCLLKKYILKNIP